MNIWLSPPPLGVDDYATNDEAIVDAIRQKVRSIEFIAGDSRYCAPADHPGYMARLKRLRAIVASIETGGPLPIPKPLPSTPERPR